MPAGAIIQGNCAKGKDRLHAPQRLASAVDSVENGPPVSSIMIWLANADEIIEVR